MKTNVAVKLLATFSLIIVCLHGIAQVQINTGTNTLDFQDFEAAGFSPTPSAGQLDSDDWQIIGFSDGDLLFGETQLSNDYTRGISEGGVTFGGIYAFDTGSGNRTFGIQQSANDFTSGQVILRTQNNTGSQIQELEIAFDIYYLNNEERFSPFLFYQGIDVNALIYEPDVDFFSPEAADALGWQSVSRNLRVTGLELQHADLFYLQWIGTFGGSVGSYDEIGIDNISILPALDADTPPRFTGADPLITELTAVDFTLTTRLDEIGTTYYVLLEDEATPPTSAQVRAGTNGDGLPALVAGKIPNSSAGSPFSGLIEGFPDNADYDLYVTAEDDEPTPNLQPDPFLLEFYARELEKIVISEFMHNPNGAEPALEWVEIFNYGPDPIDLLNFTLEDEGTNAATIATTSTIMNSGQYLILTTDKASFQNEWTGGVENSNVIQFASGSFLLSNDSDEIILRNRDGKSVWRLAYDETPASEGRSTFFNYLDNADLRDFGTEMDPGVIRNGNDAPGVLGYEGNEFTTDTYASTSSLGNTGSPLLGNYGTPLPVVLIDFRGHVHSAGAELRWVTASEVDNLGFVIERSADGRQFQDVAFVEGQGNSNARCQYSYTDTGFRQAAFYRLRQIDFDGAVEKLPTIYLTGIEHEIRVYPNPYSDFIHIDGLSFDQTVKYSLVSLSGIREDGNTNKQQLIDRLITIDPGVYHLTIDQSVTQVLVKN